MRKPLKFSVYKQLQKYSFNEYNRWLKKYYEYAYDDGYNTALASSELQYSINPEDCTVVIDNEDLKQLLLSVKGIGSKTADVVLEKLNSHGIDYSLWDNEEVISNHGNTSH